MRSSLLTMVSTGLLAFGRYMRNTILKRSALLSIAGFDPTLGAGVFQDATTFQSYGWHALAVPTVMVAENSHQMKSLQPIPPRLLSQMLKLLKGDFDIVGVKLGLLPSWTN